VSRVRENHTHGSTGRGWKRSSRHRASPSPNQPLGSTAIYYPFVRRWMPRMGAYPAMSQRTCTHSDPVPVGCVAGGTDAAQPTLEEPADWPYR